MLGSPDNPMGVTLTGGQIREITGFAAERDILVVFDQCFATVHVPGSEVPFAPNWGRARKPVDRALGHRQDGRARP